MVKNYNLKKVIVTAVLSALAFITVLLIRVPVVSFLKYEPKDVIIVIGGLVYGPLTSVIISVISSLLEMLVVSDTGIIGAVMNIISSCAFACTAAFIYKKHKNLKGAITGLVSGVFVMVVVMLLWNYFLTPIYMGYPREAVAAMLLPVFLPFNLLKGVLNAAITMLIYKPVVNSLRKAGFVNLSMIYEGEVKGSTKTGIILLSGFLLVTCIVIIMILNKMI